MAMKEISDATTLLRRKRYSLPEIVMRKCNLRSFRKRQPAAASVDEEKNRFFSKSASTVETTIDQYVSIASDPATNHAAQGSECDVKDQCCQTESVSTRHHKQKSVSRSFKCKKWRKSKSRLSRSSSTLDDSNRTSNDDSSQRPASDANANNNNNNGNNADEAKKSIRKPLVSCLNHDNRNKLATFRRLMSAPLSRSRLFSKDSFDSARNFEAEIDGRILTAGKDDNAEQQSKQVDQLVIIERSTDNWPDDSAADRVVPIISVDSEPAGNSKNSTIENEPDRSSSDGGSVAEERPNDETKPGIDDCRLNENYESAVRSIIRVRSELNSDVTTGSAKKSAESANGQSSREPFKSYSINSESNIDISISNRDRNGGENLLNYREKSTVDIRTDGENGRKEIDTPSVMFNSENTIVCEGGRDCLVTRKESRNFSLSRIDERNRSEDGSTRESADNGSVVAQRQSSEVHGKVPDSELTEGAELSPPVSVRNCDSVKLFSSDGEPDPATRSLMRPLNRPSLTYGKYYSDLPSSRAMDDLPHGKVLFNDKRYDILSTNLLPTERMVLAADGVAVSKLNRSTMEMLSDSDVSVADSLEELQLKEVTSEANCRRPNAEIKCNNNKFDDKPVRGHVSLDETERDAARIKRQSDKSIAYFIPLTTEDEMSGQEFVAVAAPKRKESIKSSKRYNENLSKDKSGKTKHISSINENAPDGTPTVCSFDEKSEQLPHIVDYPLKLFDTNLNNDKRDNDNNYNNNNINNNNNNNNNNNSNNNNNNNSVSEIVLTEFEAQKSKSSSCMDSSFRPINITECDNNEDIDEQIKRVLLGDALKVEEQAKSHATDDFSIDTPICDENVTGGIGEEIERQLSHRPKAEKQLQRHDFSSTASVDNNNNNIDDNDIDEKIKRVLLGGLQVQNRAEIGTNSTTSSSKSIQTDKSTSEQQLLMGRSRLMKARNADSTIEYYEFINLIASKTNSDFRPTNFFHCPDEVVDDDKTVVVANEQKPKKPGHRAKDTNHSFVRSTEQVIADIIKSSNRKQLSTYQAMIKKLNTTGRYRSESVIGVHPPPRQMLPQPIGRYGIPSGHKNVASSRRLTHKNKPKASSGRKSTSRKYHQTFPSIPEELTSNTSNNNSNNVNNNSSTGIHEKHPEVVVVCEGASAAKDEKAIMAAKSERDDTDQWSITNSKTMETDEAADKPTSPNERAKRSSPIRMHKGRDELLSRDDDENDRQITLSRGWINFYVLKDNSEDAGTLSVDRDKSWSTIADNETPLPDNLEEVKRYTLHIEASPQSPEPNIGRSPTFPNIEVKKHKNDFFPRIYQTEIACNNVQIATTGGNDASGDAATKLSNIFPKLRYSRGYEETSGKTNDHSVFHDRCKTNKFLPSRPVHCRMEAARSTCVPEKNPMKISDNKRPKSHQSTSSNSSTSSTEGNRWSLLIKGADNKSHSPEVKMRLSYKNAVEKSSASSKHVWTVSVRKEKAELEENKFWDGSENNDDSWKEEVNVPVNWEQRELAKTVQEQGNKRSMTLSKQNSRLYSSITADRCPDTDQIMKHIRTRWQDDLQLNNQKSELSIKGSSAGTDKRPRIPTLSERDLIRMKLL